MFSHPFGERKHFCRRFATPGFIRASVFCFFSGQRLPLLTICKGPRGRTPPNRPLFFPFAAHSLPRTANFGLKNPVPAGIICLLHLFALMDANSFFIPSLSPPILYESGELSCIFATCPTGASPMRRSRRRTGCSLIASQPSPARRIASRCSRSTAASPRR